MTLHIEKISGNGLNFEVYPDGDCILLTPVTGYIQLPASLLLLLSERAAKIKGNTPLDLSAPEGIDFSGKSCTCTPLSASPFEPMKENTDDPVLSPLEQPTATKRKKLSLKIAVPSEPIKRQINPPVGETTGWECLLKISGKKPVRHVYSSRNYARKSSLTDKIGHHGRIA